MMTLTSKEVDVLKCMATPNRTDTRKRLCYLAMLSPHQKAKVFFNELNRKLEECFSEEQFSRIVEVILNENHIFRLIDEDNFIQALIATGILEQKIKDNGGIFNE